MNDLSELLSISSSTRKYFVTLPVWLQLELHNNHHYINTTEKLHRTADILQNQSFLN